METACSTTPRFTPGMIIATQGVQALIERNVAAVRSGHRIPEGAIELELIRKDGSIIWSETSYSGICDERGEVVGAQGITRDISERKRLDIALRESEHQAQAILNQSLHLAGILTPDGIVKRVNRAALELLGTTEADVVNKPFWECSWWTHSPELQNKLREAVAGRQATLEAGSGREMLFASGSGLDPEISPQSARAQAPRVAQARGLPASRVLELVEAHLQKRFLGFMGQERVNVLRLNLALDALARS